ncbi:MAG TPA: S9 family peptidase [Allosphingosinicella sp.]|jgi:dipeptidyl aminopeptidase/acylaminoacyl peptidase|nr:S9 family peptidase [Allosphingosinicella sp.]
MFRRLIVVAALIGATTAGAQQAQDPAAAFGAREGIEQIDLSPDGRHLVYLTPGPGASTMVAVQELGGTEARVVIRTDGNPERMRWCNFVTDTRIVCRLSVLVQDGNRIVPFYRLVSVNTDGGEAQMLGQRESFFDAYLRQYDGAIIDWLPGENGVVLMSRSHVPEAGRIGSLISRRTEGLGVERVDVRNLHASSVEPPNPQANGYISDGRGHVRIMSTQTVRGATGQLGSRTDFFYRREANGRWQPLGSYDGLSGAGIMPLAVDANLNSAYVLQKLNGRFALYRIKLDGSMASELVYANDQVDVDNVVMGERGSRVIGVTFADESRRIVYFDETYANLARSLARAIPTLPLIDFVESSTDGNRILVHAGSDADPGRYFVYDRSTHNLNEILLDRPQLEHVRLANVRAVSYPSSDGVSIPGYLTLPPGGEGRNLPAIVLPHGGPSARDVWGFDWLAQYLASLGYAVLQPNYRGSAGYGDQWLKQNGFRSWRTSIGDITAGARWLAQQGIGDPRRMAIVGWSYGGYAALQSGVTDPDLFRAIVAIAPVTDLQQIKDDARLFTNARNVAEYVGSGPHIREGSPLPNAARITAPVLMFHGDRDLTVLVGHSRRMNDALRDAHRSGELVVFPGLEHDLASGDARRQMLERIRTFLASHTGAAQ